jgi:hypothetical protein
MRGFDTESQIFEPKHATPGTEFLQFATGGLGTRALAGGAVRAVTSSLAKRAASKEAGKTFAAKAAETATGLKPKTSIAKAVAQGLGWTALDTVGGTTATTRGYDVDENGDIEAKEGTELAKELAYNSLMNFATALPFEAAGAGLKVYKSSKMKTAFNNRKAKVQSADINEVRVTGEELDQVAKDNNTISQDGKFEPIAEDASLEELAAARRYGVFQTPSGRIILSTPKFGTIKLHIDKDTGAFFTKREDGNLFTDDSIFASRGKDADVNVISIIEPFFEETAEKGSAEGEMGY